jgi:pimeloyl-ACP methyl ester carboxylesterase
VLISNGLGTPHDAWPTINRQTETYRVVTWDHRGLGGSDRPSDESRITIADHTDDLFAVMDSYGIDRAVVIGWSAGVNIAFEAALRDQRRIAGVLAVGGVPGGSFEALLHPLPRFLRPRAGRVGSHLMRYLGPVLNRLGDVMPGSPEHGFDSRGVGTFGLDLVHGQTLVRVLRQFANHDWPWYSRLARAVGDHPPMDLSAIDMPVTYIAGTWDAVTSAERMRAASAQTPQSRYVELPATHSTASLIAVTSSQRRKRLAADPPDDVAAQVLIQTPDLSPHRLPCHQRSRCSCGTPQAGPASVAL